MTAFLSPCSALVEAVVEGETSTHAQSKSHVCSLAWLRFPKAPVHMQDAMGEPGSRQHGEDQRGRCRWHMRGQGCVWLPSEGPRGFLCFSSHWHWWTVDPERMWPLCTLDHCKKIVKITVRATESNAFTTAEIVLPSEQTFHLSIFNCQHYPVTIHVHSYSLGF